MSNVVEFARKPGKQKCPNCSAGRKNKNDKPLSVHYDGGVLFYRCHHCDYKGKVESDYNAQERAFKKPVYKPKTPTEKTLDWFRVRCIDPVVVQRHQIAATTFHDKAVLAFPYFRGGELVMVKYRGLDKTFDQEAGCEQILYGIDDVDEDQLVWVEGEIDKLAVETAGIRSCVSVPGGAGTNLDILAAIEPLLDTVKKHVIAGDNDEKGLELQRKLTRRLGPERCWRVEWPEGCKDANEVLMREGGVVLGRCIEDAKPIPIEGAFGLTELLPDIVRLYNEGRPSGVYCGWNNLGELYKPRLGQWTVITGSPNSGKSQFCRALLVNLAQRYDWQFAVFPPEDCPPEEYWSLLLELYVGQPFDQGPTPRMTIEKVMDASKWVDEHFVILNPPDGQRDFDALVAKGKAYVLRRGISGLVIDPWNRIEHACPAGLTMHQYIGLCLDKYSTFSRLYGLHNFIVAHPTKPRTDKNGQYVKAGLYDISDSSHWHNMADFGLVLWRAKDQEASPVEVSVQKVRSRWCGRIGTVDLHWDKVTGRYYEPRTKRDPEEPRLPGVDDYEEI